MKAEISFGQNNGVLHLAKCLIIIVSSNISATTKGVRNIKLILDNI